MNIRGVVEDFRGHANFTGIVKELKCELFLLQRHERQIELKACARVRMSIVQLSCVCLWIS